MGKNRVIINGVTYEVEGNNVSVRNGVISVDGKVIHSGLDNSVHITWHGDLASLKSDGAVTCNSIHGDVIAGGSVHCQVVNGNVGAHGSVNVATCQGDIIAGGSVNAARRR